MADAQVYYTLFAFAVAVYVYRWRTYPLRAIPTVGGPSAPIISWWTAVNFLFHGRELMLQGYQKYHGSAFKVSLLDQWMVIVNGPKLVDDLSKRPDDELSFVEGVEEFIQTQFTLGRETLDDPYHIDIIKDKLMRSLVAVVPDVIDELSVAVPEHIPVQGDDWVTINVMDTTLQIVARMSNRVFVGLPICRNQEFLNLAIRFTIDIITDNALAKAFPLSVKIFLGKHMSNARKSIRKAMPYLVPLLRERRAKMEEFGDGWTDKPNDLVQWVLEEAIPRNSDDEAIVGRILLVNFAAIHTSSNSIVHALYDLAANPEYIQPLRDEIAPIVAQEGWTKGSMGRMWKLDSFLRESQRVNGVSLTSVIRKAMVDVTLSDGTFLPKDTLVVAASYPTHQDEHNYPSPAVFDGFRFSRMREAEGEITKHQFVNTSVDYIPFGHGKHACPGRFFAANELKAMLAYIVLNYDMKIAGDGSRPENIYLAVNVIPNPKGEIKFRQRQPVSVSV
ncbi:cytochrome P450 [Daedaleopsis nitida]|nr:cytochrome P450 [Daedaleopsis nitida]